MSNDPSVSLFLVLPAIAEMVDERHLSKKEALAQLSQMLGKAASAPDVKEALIRLRSAKDDLSFRVMLGEECLRAMDSCD